MTRSSVASLVTRASVLYAQSATTPWPSMASRIARQHASLDGASLVASRAPSQHRAPWVAALASLHLWQHLAWRWLCDLSFSVYFGSFVKIQFFPLLLMLFLMSVLAHRCACQV